MNMNDVIRCLIGTLPDKILQYQIELLDKTVISNIMMIFSARIFNVLFIF